jgi:hypothetical protein
MKLEEGDAPQFAHAPPFEDWFCVDFVSKRDGDIGLRVFSPKNALSLAPIQAKYENMSLGLGNFRWDNSVIRYAPAELDRAALRAWFNKWFAPSHERKPAGAPLSGNIHFVTLGDGALKIDFGTAPAEAFWSVLDVLKASGATHVTIASGDPLQA